MRTSPLVLLLVLAACGAEPSSTTDTSDTSSAPDSAPADIEPADTDPVDSEPADTDPTDSADAAPADTDSNDASTWPETLGASRPARVITPAGYAGERLFAIVLLGGYDYFARDLDDWLGLSETVDSRDFLLILPDGLVDEDGSPFWNATDTCCDYYGTGVDDVAYLTSLFDELEARFPVSGIGLVGHSAGGFMAYRMACEVPARLSAVVSIAGSGYLDPADCAITDVPLAVLQVHGDADDIMPFDGDDEAPGALEMLERWGGTNGCRLRSWVTEGLSPNMADEGKTVVGTYRDDCTEDVRLWRLEGSDHYPSFTATFLPRLLDWLISR